MKLDAFIKRAFVIIPGSMIAVSAYFHASGVSPRVAHEVAQDSVSSAHEATAPVEPPSSDDRAPSAAPSLARDPFDPTTGPLDAGPDRAAAGQADRSSLDPRRAPPCDSGRVVLIAVSDDPDWSFAAIEAADGTTTLWRRGGRIDGRTLEQIAWDRVVLTSGGARCQMLLGERGRGGGKAAPEPQPTPDPPRATPSRRPGKSHVPPEIASSIQRVSDTEIDIDRSAAEKIFANPELVTHTSAAIPEMRDDQVVGLKMHIKPGSVLESFGLQTGDLVRSVNGIDLTNPQNAMMAYSRMQSDSSVSVVVERGGRPMRLKVNLR
ncbi:type II secretion system protein GspC [Sorangium sp. So ce1036]|uniref:type II secretion system protein GspC n=1 Tax=Sorangium sp. So ce1036 TaxID=3133328 RepID=UPI003F0DE04D